MEKIVFKTDFEILKRKLIKVFIFIVILCLWMLVPNIQNFPADESSIHLKIIIFPILTAIFILLFEVLKRKAQIIESNIFMLAAIFNYSVFVNRIQIIIFIFSYLVLYIIYYSTIKIVIDNKNIKFYEFGIRKVNLNFLEKEVVLEEISYERFGKRYSRKPITVEVLRAFKKVKYFGKRMILQESIDWLSTEDKEKLREILSESIVLEFKF
mgnify:FL=1